MDSKRVAKGALASSLLHINKKGSLVFPFDSPRASYWYSGQTAIWQGLHSLNLRPNDGILVPAYACGSEIDVLEAFGFNLVFYPVDESLVPDLSNIDEQALSSCRALYVTHYFGFPQPMRSLVDFAAQHELLVLEDNAHGLFSAADDGTPLGSYGDMAIFSITKMLPVLDGGLLLIDHGTEKGVSPPPIATLRKFSWLLAQELIYRLPRSLFRKLAKSRYRHQPTLSEYRALNTIPSMEVMSWTMSATSLWMLRHFDQLSVKDSRRANYKTLESCVPVTCRLRPLLRNLPENCCPWFYPVWASDAQALVKYLRNRHIWSDRFWPYPHPSVSLTEFPVERDLMEHVVVLPINHDLNPDTMRKIGEALCDWDMAR